MPMLTLNRLSLLCVLPTLLHGKTHASPIKDQIDAIAPSCTTLASGSTTCNVGINSLPTLGPSLDGGYQWISIEPTTIMDSGTVIATDEGVWTNTQTDYVTVAPVTTTVSGSTITSTSTGYFSFITETAVGQAGGPVIAAVVIAPAVIPALQPVADSIVASTATVTSIANQIVKQLGAAGFVISSADATNMATVLLTMSLSTSAFIANRLHKLPSWLPSLSVKPPMNTPKTTHPKTTPSSTKTSSSITSTVTAIAFPPYSNWRDLTIPVGIPTGPIPSGTDLGITTSKSLGCSFVATVYPTSLTLAIPGTRRYCICDTYIAQVALATSGTSTVSYCDVGYTVFQQTIPTGFTPISAENGTPYSSAPKTTSTPPPTTSIAPPPAPKTTAQPTTTAPNPSSSACVQCGSDLGASSCKSGDSSCLIDQCSKDTNCQQCGIECSTYTQP